MQKWGDRSRPTLYSPPKAIPRIDSSFPKIVDKDVSYWSSRESFPKLFTESFQVLVILVALSVKLADLRSLYVPLFDESLYDSDPTFCVHRDTSSTNHYTHFLLFFHPSSRAKLTTGQAPLFLSTFFPLIYSDCISW